MPGSPSVLAPPEPRATRGAGYRTLLLHAGTDAGSRRRMAIAAALGRWFGATVMGVGADHFDPSNDPSFGYLSAAALIESQQKHQQALEHGREAFMAAGIGHAEWRGADGFPTEALLAHARGADLLIASRPGHGAVPSRSVNPADLAMRSGLPLLLLPEALEELRPRRILIGWKDSRESRRAVGDALPFLRRAEHVVLSAVAEGEDEASTIASLNDVAQRLLRHDVAVEIQLESKAPAGVLDTLLRSASTHQADLLVLGAYGHSRAREWLFGGVTEAVLDASPIAVLLSH